MELVRQNDSIEQSAVVSATAAGNQRAKPQKYVSMFNIDGVPILPPLMTTEKRRQMIKYRERAMRIEQRLEEQRRHAPSIQYPSKYSAVLAEREAAFLSTSDTSSSGASTERSIDPQTEQESYALLSKLIAEHEADGAAQTESSERGYEEHPSLPPEVPLKTETQLEERMQKLQKSETLIYDNSSNAIIMSISDFEDMRQRCESNEAEVRMLANNASLSKPAIVDENKLKNIPAICVDPPTPLVVNRCFTEAIEAAAASDGGGACAPTSQQRLCYEEFSSDESYNCAQSCTILNKDTTVSKKNNNIAAKIIKFEQYQAPPCSPSDNLSLRLSDVRTPKRSATSPSLKEFSEKHENKNDFDDYPQGPQSESGLVRSNSFTLDYPSKALLEHMNQLSPMGVAASGKRSGLSSSATRDTIESKAKRVQKAASMQTKCHSPTRLQSKMSATNISAGMNKPGLPPASALHSHKSKRSPYDTKTIIKKTARPLKKSSAKVKSRCSLPTVPVMPKRGVQSSRSSPIDMLNEMETEHRQRFMQLLQHQQSEQERMQLAFEQQQQQLFEQLATEMGHMRLRSPNAGGGAVSGDYQMYSPQRSAAYNAPMLVKADVAEYVMRSPAQSANGSVMSSSMCITTSSPMDLPSDVCAMSPSYPYAMCVNKFTPRRRLFGGTNHSASDSTNANVRVRSANSSPTSASSQGRREQQKLEQQRRHAAATKINSHVRGYLVRRLFQTEQIQRIVQTIRDTLIFVLNLHLETTQNPEEAHAPDNIKLKARLLQQLASASRTLHLVFFQTTVKERMDIIGRDRKRIKTKMLTLNMKRSPRITT